MNDQIKQPYPERIHALRTLALKLNVSGTAEVLDQQKLYQGSYGFVKFQVYAPVTQNTGGMMCTAYSVTEDTSGNWKRSSKNYPLLYVDKVMLSDKLMYCMFEAYLPKEWTDTVGQLHIIINYSDSAEDKDEDGNAILDEHGIPKRHATHILVSSHYDTYVYPGGWNDESLDLEFGDEILTQVGDNTSDIQDLRDDISDLQQFVFEDNGLLAMQTEKARAMEAEEALGKRIDDTNSNVDDLNKNKMDKVKGAVKDNFVALDENGNSVDSGVSAKTIQAAHDLAYEAKTIALERDYSMVFDTKAEMDAFLANPENKLPMGSNLFIRDPNESDYWWDGTQAIEEHDKTDLTPYFNKDEVTKLVGDTKDSIVRTYDLPEVVTSPNNAVTKIVHITREEYDALGDEVDSQSVYVIEDDVPQFTVDEFLKITNALEARITELERIIGGMLS